MLVNLNQIASVNEFVKICSNFDCDVTIKSEKYIVNGKSLLGVFSLDLTNPVELVIEASSDAELAECTDKLKKFIVK